VHLSHRADTHITDPASTPVLTHPDLDRIKTDYHPNSKRSSDVDSFEDYGRNHSKPAPPDGDPWSPYFKSLEDFEFSEVVLEGALSERQADRLIKIIRRCLDGRGTFTMSGVADMHAGWERASERLAPVHGLTLLNDSSLTFRGELVQ
jgi:hypothetical protein